MGEYLDAMAVLPHASVVLADAATSGRCDVPPVSRLNGRPEEISISGATVHPLARWLNTPWPGCKPLP